MPDVQAVDLPLVDGEEDGLVYLLMPGFEDDAIQGIQFEVFEEEGLLNVYCYESGFEEAEDCEGMVFPIALTDNNLPVAQNLETLRIVDPGDLENLEQLPRNDQSKIEARYERFRAS